MRETDPQVIHTSLPTSLGDFLIYVWPGERGHELIAITTPSINSKDWVTIRVHSECITGDLFGCGRCDCGAQKQAALTQIHASENGMLIYHRQEGRNYGLYEKMKVHQHDDTHKQGFIAAWENLEMTQDRRDYSEIEKVLKYFQIKKVKLLTNNTNKETFFNERGIETKRVSLHTEPTKHNTQYLDSKDRLEEYR
jgi:3,4-dihydroxy 2-butanone 4-phosphate synthase/GTP cyclohydrolase II